MASIILFYDNGQYVIVELSILERHIFRSIIFNLQLLTSSYIELGLPFSTWLATTRRWMNNTTDMYITDAMFNQL